MGMFISALVLASLCLSYIMEIISFTVEPHPVKRPLLLVVVGAVSVLHKMLVLGLNWDELLDWSKASRQPGTKSHLVVNHKGNIDCSLHVHCQSCCSTIQYNNTW